MEQSNLSQLRWRADDYLQHFFPEGLTRETVLHFFAESPFYDKQSNNQVIRMQTQYQAEQSMQSLEHQLRYMTGIEFVVTEAQPPDLFVIQKRYREGPDRAHIMAVYYVLNDIVCQSADLYTLMASRLLNATEALRASLQEFRIMAPPFDVRRPSPPWTLIEEPADTHKLGRKDENVDLLLRRALAGGAKRSQIANKPAVPGRTPTMGTPSIASPRASSPKASAAATPKPGR